MDIFEPDEILRRIREEAQRIKTAKVPKDWREPTAADFRPDARLLCFDQSLSNSGWALLSTAGGEISVTTSGTLRPPVLEREVKGFELTLTKSVMLSRQLAELLRILDGQFEQVAIELPSVFGYRTESSLVAAVTVCAELDRMGRPLPVLVSRNSAGAVLCGDRFAPKSVSSNRVATLVGERRPDGRGQWTEHVRDAVFVGLRHLYREEW